MMKKLLTLLLHLLQQQVNKGRDTEDETWNHLDGAEFLAILPESTPRLTSE